MGKFLICENDADVGDGRLQLLLSPWNAGWGLVGLLHRVTPYCKKHHPLYDAIPADPFRWSFGFSSALAFDACRFFPLFFFLFHHGIHLVGRWFSLA